MNYDIFYPVRIYSLLPLKLLRALRSLFLALGFTAGIAYIVFLFVITTLPTNLFAAIFLILTPIGLSIAFFEIFLHFKLFNPPVDEHSSTSERLNFYVKRVFYHAYYLEPAGEITIPDLTLALLHEPEAQILWIRMGIPPESVDEFFTQALREQMSQERNQIDIDAILQKIEAIRLDHKTENIDLTDLLIVLFDENPLLQQFLEQQWDYPGYHKHIE